MKNKKEKQAKRLKLNRPEMALSSPAACTKAETVRTARQENGLVRSDMHRETAR
jgi:hypothetical protein